MITSRKTAVEAISTLLELETLLIGSEFADESAIARELIDEAKRSIARYEACIECIKPCTASLDTTWAQRHIIATVSGALLMSA